MADMGLDFDKSAAEGEQLITQLARAHRRESMGNDAMSPQIELFGEPEPARPAPDRQVVLAVDAWRALDLELAIAQAEELHEDHWPRWLAFAVNRVRAGNPWLTVPAGELHPFRRSVPVPRPYRVASPMAAALMRIGWRPGEG